MDSAHLFGVGWSTVCKVVHETCQAIVDHLLPKYIYFPSVDQQQQYIDDFESKWGVPQCIGAVDDSYVRTCFTTSFSVTQIIIIIKAGITGSC